MINKTCIIYCHHGNKGHGDMLLLSLASLFKFGGGEFDVKIYTTDPDLFLVEDMVSVEVISLTIDNLWQRFHACIHAIRNFNYGSYMYLDSDTLIINDLNLEKLSKVELNVKRENSFTVNPNIPDLNFWGNHLYQPGTRVVGYNSGSIGFNRTHIDFFEELISLTSDYDSDMLIIYGDQPLFNYLLNVKDIRLNCDYFEQNLLMIYTSSIREHITRGWQINQKPIFHFANNRKVSVKYPLMQQIYSRR